MTLFSGARILHDDKGQSYRQNVCNIKQSRASNVRLLAIYSCSLHVIEQCSRNVHNKLEVQPGDDVNEIQVEARAVISLV